MHKIHFSPEVAKARQDGKAVVALESTIITHGMPYPKNLACAQKVEQIVRDGGAVPATVAIVSGNIHVGLTEQEIGYLAKKGPLVQKCTRREIPQLMACEADGATTVASTLFIANRAQGIKVFVTGGVGGVHRGAFEGKEPSLDVSADLLELAHTPMVVVCAGIKSILHVPHTLEYLETVGVGVLSWQSEYFPEFFSASSGIKSPRTVSQASDLAKMMHAAEALEMSGGMLVAVPNPRPVERRVIDGAIQQALRSAEEQGISGKDVTPFILAKVNEITRGSSLEANLELIQNNAHVGTEIAKAYACGGN